MTGPKHLWSGDWERESAATSGTETDRRQDQQDPAAGENAATTPAQTTETSAGNERRNGRIAVAGTITVLLIAVIAIVATSGGPDPKTPTSAAAIPTIPAPPGTIPNQTIPNLTIPSPATPTPTTPHHPHHPDHPDHPDPTPTTPTTSSTPAAPAVAPQPVSWLGMEILTIPSGAAVVDAVTAGGVADRAGLTPGDIIVEVDHHGVTGSASIAHAVRDKHKGDVVTVTVVRGGTSLDAQTTFTGPPTAYP